MADKDLSGIIGAAGEYPTEEQRRAEVTRLAEETVESFFSGTPKANTAADESVVAAPRKTETLIREITATDEVDMGEIITHDMIEEKLDQKARKQASAGDDDIKNLLDAVSDEEDARLETLDEMGAEAYSAAAKKEQNIDTAVRSVDQDELRRSSGDPEYGIVNDADFTPDYYNDDADDEPAEAKAAESAENYDSAEEVVSILAKAPTITYENTSGIPTPVKAIRSRKMRTEVVSSGKLESKILADQAFENSANKFKKQNFRTVRVPLVNSGFFVDLVGTGANDLVMLYDNTDQHIGASEYEMNRMRTILKSVVGTEPKVDPAELKNVIHHKDYVMMAYGHLCATLAEVVFPHTCDKCNHTLKIKANPADMLLNLSELKPKVDSIESSRSAADNSLMAANVNLEFPSGFTVTIAHPSYYDEVVMLNALNHYIQTLKPIEALPMAKMANNLLYVKSISLPNGLRASNVYQTFKALRLMELEEYDQVLTAISDTRKNIIEPKFGVSNITCPICKETIETVELDSVESLVFFLTMVIQAEKEATKKQA